MSDNKQSNSTSVNGNKNTLVLIVVVMLALVALLMFFNLPRNQASHTNTDELSTLRNSIAEKESSLAAKGIPLPVDTSSIDTLSKRISQDALQLSSTLEKFQVALSSKESALTKAKSDLQAALTTNQHLSTETAKMRKQLSTVQNTQSNAAFYKQEVERLNKALLERDTRISELSKRPTSQNVSDLISQLNENLLINEKLNQRIKELEIPKPSAPEPSVPENALLQKLQEENNKLRATLKSLKPELPKLPELPKFPNQ